MIKRVTGLLRSRLTGSAALGATVTVLSLSGISGCAQSSSPLPVAPNAPVLSPSNTAPTSGANSLNTLPDKSEYVVVQDGHLAIRGRRTKFWSVIGKTFITPELEPGDSPAVRKQKIDDARRGTDVLVQRFFDLGFNSTRLWAAAPNTEDYQIGDGSAADAVDYFLAEMKKRGGRIWLAALNNVGDAEVKDAGIVDDPGTVELWKKAVEASDGKVSLRGSLARVWDRRLEALHIERMKQVAMHTNKHTGLRWADDPVFGVWELTNEE